MRLTLADVLGEEDFGLVLRSGSPATLSRPVAGAETVEVDRPVELSAQDYIILTTGVRLRGNPQFQRRLVMESEARGVAAIGFGVGLGFRSLPRALLEEAQARDFPVFEVPFEVPFRDIIAYINRSHLSADFYSLKRSVALQNSLLGALGEARPEDALVARLGTIVGGSAVLYRPGGGIVAQAGEAPAGELWKAIVHGNGATGAGDGLRPPVGRGGAAGVAATGARVTLDSGSWRIVASPIHVEGALRFWLVLAGRGDLAAGGIIEPLVEVTERLMRVIELARDVGVMEERVRRSELLGELLDARRARDVSAGRLEVFGLSAGGPWRVVLLRPADVDSLADATRILGNIVGAGGHPHLLGPHHQHVAMVVANDAPVEAWTQALVDSGVHARAAVGRPVTRPDQLVESCGDALLALDFLSRMGPRPGQVLRFEDFEFVDALLCSADAGQLQARSAFILEPLRTHPQLFETLVAYLDADLNINAAAARLHLHPNSLRYRLARVEEILGRSTRSLATVVDLHLALRAEARFGSEAAGGDSGRSP